MVYSKAQMPTVFLSSLAVVLAFAGKVGVLTITPGVGGVTAI